MGRHALIEVHRTSIYWQEGRAIRVSLRRVEARSDEIEAIRDDLR